MQRLTIVPMIICTWNTKVSYTYKVTCKVACYKQNDVVLIVFLQDRVTYYVDSETHKVSYLVSM